MDAAELHRDARVMAGRVIARRDRGRFENLRRAGEEGLRGIMRGWQNGSGIENRLAYLALFQRLGMRVIQITLNAWDLAGSGCYESRDSGLSDFGCEPVAGMKRLGMLCELSHVGRLIRLSPVLGRA